MAINSVPGIHHSGWRITDSSEDFHIYVALKRLQYYVTVCVIIIQRNGLDTYLMLISWNNFS